MYCNQYLVVDHLIVCGRGEGEGLFASFISPYSTLSSTIEQGEQSLPIPKMALL